MFYCNKCGYFGEYGPYHQIPNPSGTSLTCAYQAGSYHRPKVTPERETEIRNLMRGSLMCWPASVAGWLLIVGDLLTILDQEREGQAK